MAKYMAGRIIEEAYSYTYVITQRSDLKTGIDAYLAEKERTDLIV